MPTPPFFKLCNTTVTNTIIRMPNGSPSINHKSNTSMPSIASMTILLILTITYTYVTTQQQPLLNCLESMCCENSYCGSSIKQTLKCDAKLYSSSLISIDYTQSSYSSCFKTVPNKDGKTDKTLYCTYYIAIGYGSLRSKQNTNSVSFIVCYDNICDIDNMEEQVIETSFNSDSISLTTYSDSLTTIHQR